MHIIGVKGHSICLNKLTSSLESLHIDDEGGKRKITVLIRSVLAIRVQVLRMLRPWATRSRIVHMLTFLFGRDPTKDEVDEWTKTVGGLKMYKQLLTALQTIPDVSWAKPIIQESGNWTAREKPDLLVIRDLLTSGDVSSVQLQGGYVITFDVSSHPRSDFVVTSKPKCWDSVAQDIGVRVGLVTEKKADDVKTNWTDRLERDLTAPWLIVHASEPKQSKPRTKTFEMWM
jgi:hypothetical protein